MDLSWSSVLTGSWNISMFHGDNRLRKHGSDDVTPKSFLVPARRLFPF